MKAYINSSKIYPTARNFQFQMATRAGEPAKTDEFGAQSRSMQAGYKTFSDFHNFSGASSSLQPSHQTSVNFYREPSPAMDRLEMIRQKLTAHTSQLSSIPSNKDPPAPKPAWPRAQSVGRREEEKNPSIGDQVFSVPYMVQRCEQKVFTALRTTGTDLKPLTKEGIEKAFRELKDGVSMGEQPKMGSLRCSPETKKIVDEMNAEFAQARQSIKLAQKLVGIELDKLEFDLNALKSAIKVSEKRSGPEPYLSLGSYASSSISKRSHSHASKESAAEPPLCQKVGGIQKELAKLAAEVKKMEGKVKVYEGLFERKDSVVQSLTTSYKPPQPDLEPQLSQKNSEISKLKEELTACTQQLRKYQLRHSVQPVPYPSDTGSAERVSGEALNFLSIMDKLKRAIIKKDEVGTEKLRVELEEHKKILSRLATEGRRPGKMVNPWENDDSAQMAVATIQKQKKELEYQYEKQAEDIVKYQNNLLDYIEKIKQKDGQIEGLQQELAAYRERLQNLQDEFGSLQLSQPEFGGVGEGHIQLAEMVREASVNLANGYEALRTECEGKIEGLAEALHNIEEKMAKYADLQRENVMRVRMDQAEDQEQIKELREFAECMKQEKEAAEKERDRAKESLQLAEKASLSSVKSLFAHLADSAHEAYSERMAAFAQTLDERMGQIDAVRGNFETVLNLLGTQINDQIDEIEQLKEENGKLRGEIAEKGADQTEVLALQGQIETLTRHIEEKSHELEETVQRLEDEKQRAEQESGKTKVVVQKYVELLKRVMDESKTSGVALGSMMTGVNEIAATLNTTVSGYDLVRESLQGSLMEMKENYDSLKSALAEKEYELGSAAEEVQTQKGVVDGLNEKLVAIQAKLAEAETKSNTSMETMRKEWEAAIAKLGNEKATSETAVKKLREEIEELEAGNKSLVEANDLLDQKVSETQKRVKELESELELALKSQNETTADLHQELAKLRQENATLSASLSDTNKALNAKDEDLANRDSTIYGLEAELSQLRSDHEELVESYKVAAHEKEVLEARIKAAEANLKQAQETIQKEIKEKEAEIQAAQEESKGFQSDAQTARAESEALSQEKSELEARIKAAEETNVGLQGDLKEAQDKTEALAQEKSELEARIKAAEEANVALKGDLEALSQEKSELETRIKAAEEANIALKGDLKLARERVESLTQEKTTLESTLKTAQESPQQTIEALTHQKSTLETQLKEVQESLKVSTEKMGALTQLELDSKTRLEKKTCEISLLKDSLKFVKENCGFLRGDVESIKTQLGKAISEAQENVNLLQTRVVTRLHEKDYEIAVLKESVSQYKEADFGGRLSDFVKALRDLKSDLAWVQSAQNTYKMGLTTDLANVKAAVWDCAQLSFNNLQAKTDAENLLHEATAREDAVKSRLAEISHVFSDVSSSVQESFKSFSEFIPHLKAAMRNLVVAKSSREKELAELRNSLNSTATSEQQKISELVEKSQSLQDRVDKLEAEKRALEDREAKFDSEKLVFEEKITELEGVIKRKDDEITGLQGEMGKLRGEKGWKDRLTIWSENAKAGLEDLKRSHEKILDSFKKMEIAEMVQKTKQLCEENRALKAAKKALEEKMADSHKEIEEWKSARETNEEEGSKKVAEISQENATLEAECETLKERIAGQEEKIAELEQTHKKLQDDAEHQNKEYASQIEALKTDYAALRKENTDLTQKCDTLQVEAGSNEFQIEDLRSTISQKDAQIHAISFQKEKCMEGLRKCQATIVHIRGTLKSLEVPPHETLAESLSGIKTAFEIVTSENLRLKNQPDTSKQWLEEKAALEVRLKNLEEKLEWNQQEHEIELEALRNDIEEKTEGFAQEKSALVRTAGDALRKLKEKFEKTAQNWETSVVSVLEDKHLAVKFLGEQLHDVSAKISGNKTALEKAHNKITNLQTMLESERENSEHFANNLQQSVAKVKKLEDEKNESSGVLIEALKNTGEIVDKTVSSELISLSKHVGNVLISWHEDKKNSVGQEETSEKMARNLVFQRSQQWSETMRLFEERVKKHMKVQIEKMGSLVEKYQKNCARDKIAIEMLKMELTKTKGENQGIKEELINLLESVGEHKGGNTFTQIVEEIKAAFENHTEEIITLQQRLNENDQVKKSLRDRLINPQTALNPVLAKLDTMSIRLTEMGKVKEILREKISGQSSTIADLRDALAEAKSDINVLARKQAESQGEKMALEGRLKEANEMLEEYSKVVTEASEELYKTLEGYGVSLAEDQKNSLEVLVKCTNDVLAMLAESAANKNQTNEEAAADEKIKTPEGENLELDDDDFMVGLVQDITPKGSVSVPAPAKSTPAANPESVSFKSGEDIISPVVTAKDAEDTPPAKNVSSEIEWQSEREKYAAKISELEQNIEVKEASDVRWHAEYEDLKTRIRSLAQKWGEGAAEGTIDEVERAITKMAEEIEKAKKEAGGDTIDQKRTMLEKDAKIAGMEEEVKKAKEAIQERDKSLAEKEKAMEELTNHYLAKLESVAAERAEFQQTLDEVKEEYMELLYTLPAGSFEGKLQSIGAKLGLETKEYQSLRKSKGRESLSASPKKK